MFLNKEKNRSVYFQPSPNQFKGWADTAVSSPVSSRAPRLSLRNRNERDKTYRRNFTPVPSWAADVRWRLARGRTGRSRSWSQGRGRGKWRLAITFKFLPPDAVSLLQLDLNFGRQNFEATIAGNDLLTKKKHFRLTSDFKLRPQRRSTINNKQQQTQK